MKKIKQLIASGLLAGVLIGMPTFGEDACFNRKCSDGSTPIKRAFREVEVSCVLDEEGFSFNGGVTFLVYTCSGGENWECFFSSWVWED